MINIVTMKYPVRYLPKALENNDKKKYYQSLNKSKKLYKRGIYFLRPKIKSFKSKKSNHIQNAKRIYNVSEIVPSKKLSMATGCSIKALKKIVNKGEGAYYSSGSRPNQTPQSWGYARLASSLTAGKAAAVDFDIINNGCNHNKLAYKLALKSRKQYNHGHSSSKKTKFIYKHT
jgi:hypothetical protein